MHGQQGLAFQVCANKLTSQETKESAYKNNKTQIRTHMYHIPCSYEKDNNQCPRETK